MTVQLQRVTQANAKIGPQLHVVIDDIAQIGGYRHVLVTIVDQALCISALF